MLQGRCARPPRKPLVRYHDFMYRAGSWGCTIGNGAIGPMTQKLSDLFRKLSQTGGVRLID